MAKRETVIFVGAGLSAWSGVPTWKSLLMQLAGFRDREGLSSELIRREIASNDLLQAASYGFMDLSLQSRREFLIDACLTATAAPSAAHELLLKLPPTCFITTNFDTLLEQAIAAYRTGSFYSVVTNRQRVDQPSLILATSSKFLFKPHGDINDMESIVLTREDYRRLAHEWSYTHQTLRTLMVTVLWSLWGSLCATRTS